MVFVLICQIIAVLGLLLVLYWMRGTALFNRAASAYRRGDLIEGDRLTKRAQRWAIGTKAARR